jgi:hypothetical protein
MFLEHSQKFLQKSQNQKRDEDEENASVNSTLMDHLHWQTLHNNARDNAGDNNTYCTCLGSGHRLDCFYLCRCTHCGQGKYNMSHCCRCYRSCYSVNFCQWKHSLNDMTTLMSIVYRCLWQNLLA